MAQPLKVLINAQIPPGGKWGGVEQFLMGLVYALGRLADGEERYTLITLPESPDWLRSLMGSNQRIVVAPQPKIAPLIQPKQLLGPLRRPAGKLLRRVRRIAFRGASGYALPQSEGFYESLGGDIMHFPFQEFIRSRIPSIYNPWDLQHLYYPKFFSANDMAVRETVFPGACHSARAVVAPSCAVKGDLQRHYGLDPQKIFVIPCAPPAALYEDIPNEAADEVRKRFRLPDLFAFYPAQTWPHKNHLRLLEALHLIRERNGVRLNLVCTGRKNEHWPAISRRIDELGLQTQVIFPGFVSPRELRALYRLAQFVVYPSFFEGAGLPVMEALYEDVAVACSDIPPLREYGGDAVMTFDPLSVESMAASLLLISSDDALREQLRARGRERARLFTWERTGKTYRALYRQVAGVAMSEEDLQLLTSDNLLTMQCAATPGHSTAKEMIESAKQPQAATPPGEG
jgi:glycosyltransferase involved in cell wall biosynthesis